MTEKGWSILRTSEAIDLGKTLFSGQVFSFKQTGEREYTGVLGESLVSFLQDGSRVFYKMLSGSRTVEEIEDDISHFFTLDVKLQPLLQGWGSEEGLAGLRALRYGLIPTIFSFICSSNNNISRITRMVWFLYSKGRHITRYKNSDFHHFPELERLVDIEDELRANGFGYRAAYVCEGARYILANYALLQEKSRMRELLVSIRGVGNKVADCILLIGMGDLSVVPIDTHIFKHSKERFGIRAKSLTGKTYRTIQELYEKRFGRYAGIAQLYIFKRTVDLRARKAKGGQNDDLHRER